MILSSFPILPQSLYLSSHPTLIPTRKRVSVTAERLLRFTTGTML
jgi:hypothetical protein